MQISALWLHAHCSHRPEFVSEQTKILLPVFSDDLFRACFKQKLPQHTHFWTAKS